MRVKEQIVYLGRPTQARKKKYATARDFSKSGSTPLIALSEKSELGN